MSATPGNCFHLTVGIVLEIHAAAINQFGGSDGVRDTALLESAVAAPQATFAGNSPYADVIEIAAAYLFYLCRNHPFLDGNKRAALGACLVYLQLNGLDPAEDGPAWESLTLDVAASQIDRDQTTARLRKLVKPSSRSSKPKKKETMKLPTPALLVLLLTLGACSKPPTDPSAGKAAPGAVHHVVVCWLKEPGNEMARAQLIGTSLGFKDLPGVVDVSAGPSLSSERPEVDDSFDVALTMTFRDEAVLHAYENHPAHKKAVEDVLKPLVARFVVYDFVGR